MIGQRLSDRYEIVSELGRGGMGVVYRARDPLLKREVAVKIIPPSLVTESTEQRFHAEAQLVARMDHPAIVSIFDFGRHGDSFFFVMPIVEGTNLRQLMQDRSLVLGEVIDIGIGVAEALEYSHARGVVHRDVKPENVMVARGEAGGLRVRVMDFGLAKSTRVTRLTKTGMLLGTVAYVSPEQVSGETMDGRSDIYSLGTVLYECVANDVPFSGEMQSVLYRIVHEIPQSPRGRGAEIGPELEDIILSCLAKEPSKRPQRAGDLAQALRRHKSELRDSERRKSVTITRTIQAQRPPVSPFVGRKREMKELQERLNGAVAGECQFVVISGEPGIGKTRLLDELEALARARQIRVLHGRSVERDAAFPYHGFCEAIQEYFRQREFGSAGSGPPDFSDIGADLIALFPMLSEIETIRAASGPTERLPQPDVSRLPENRTQIFELLARTLTRLAGGKTLVLVLEDLHGADASIEALQYIVRRLGPTPTLIVGTYRSTEVDRRHPLNRLLEGFQGDRRFASIALGPFSLAEHRAFLKTLVGGTEIADELVTKLHEGSEGNPFFTKELVRALVDAGNIVRDDSGEWVLSGGVEISSDALPVTIQQAVERRIERLPDHLRDILSIASVIGKTFDFRDLEALAEGKRDLDEAVDDLVREGLIEEARQSRGDRLTFSSGLVREVLYAELSRRKRRSLHRKYARELEQRHSGRLERVYPQLVYHFSEGDVPEKTVEYGLRHARNSLETFSPDDAVRAAKTVLDFVDEEWGGERSIEAEARMLLARAYQMSGETGGALREFNAAIRVYEREGQLGETVGALLMAARAAWHGRQTEEARRWVVRGLEVARDSGDGERLAQFLSLAATLANLRGEYGRAAEYLREARQLGADSAEQEGGDETPGGGTLRVAFANPVTTRHPAAMQLVEENECLSNVFEPMLSTDPEGNLVPSLCESWEVRDSGQSLLLTLREGIRFHDGHELTAHDVKRSFEEAIRAVGSDLPAAFGPVRGRVEFGEGRTEGLEGIRVESDRTLEIRLEERLPIYPAFLTDVRAAVVRVAEGDDETRLVGTGPFLVSRWDERRIVLERNERYWRGTPPKLDALEFLHGLSASSVAAGVRSGEIDVARDLSPQDLDELLGDPRFRAGLVEAPQKNTYFVLFNARSGPATEKVALRRALSGVVRPHDRVWRTLGRFAQPAVGLLPPGILGHDAGKRPRPLSLEEARDLLRSAELPEPVRLKASVHPLIQDRYGSLLRALFAAWGELGVEVSVETPDMSAFLRSWQDSTRFDLVIGRWIADYDDPDNFTHTLFCSASGKFHRYYSSPEADRVFDLARAESRPVVREHLYRRFENHLMETGVLAPLFHDVDYRIATPHVRGIAMGNSFPVVNYSELGKTEEPVEAPAVQREAGGVLRIPRSEHLSSLDPALIDTVEEGDVLPGIYETLIRDVGEAQIVPWLAEEFDVEERGRRYCFRLRNDVRFHDGRRLTARDVRYSLERLLQSPHSQSRRLFAAIVGAEELIEGSRGDLAGFHIRSATEFAVELEKPLSFFLALLSFSGSAIVPEGADRFDRTWREGTVGTGPFRVVGFDAGRHLELERNPHYWREGFPRSDQLVFTFGVQPKDILSGFKAGRFSLASDLFPADVEALRREAGFAPGYREAPRLSTYFVAFNANRGALRDRDLRKRLLRSLDVGRLVRQTLGQLAIPAHGLIPPGLLGHEPAARSELAFVPPQDPPESAKEVALSAALHPVLSREYSGVLDVILEAFGREKVVLKPATDSLSEFNAAVASGSVDVAVGRWTAGYPDADSFAQVLRTEAGWYGKMCGSAKLDRFIEQGREETDPETRHSIYRQLSDALSREARILPLFHEQVYRFARPEVEGLSVSYCFSYEDLRARVR